MILYQVGDATQPSTTSGSRIIVHVCNDQGYWGAGFVLALSKRWKAPEEEYLQQFEEFHSDSDVRGLRLGELQLIDVEDGIWVANLVAQHGLRRPGNLIPLDFEALETCLTGLARFWVDKEDVSFHMPRIGCGLAGGKWEEVEPILRRTLGVLHVPIIVYDLP